MGDGVADERIVTGEEVRLPVVNLLDARSDVFELVPLTLAEISVF